MKDKQAVLMVSIMFGLTWFFITCQGTDISNLETQVKSLQELKSKLPMTITVNVSPELARPRTLKWNSPGLPTWQSISAQAGKPYPKGK